MGAKPKTERAAAKPSNDALRAVFAGAVAKPAAAKKGDKRLKGGSQASASGTSAGPSRNDPCRPWSRCAGATPWPAARNATIAAIRVSRTLCVCAAYD